MRFRDRNQAGEQLGELLASRRYPRPVVVALARGGIMTAAPVARRLNAPLDVVFARKIPHPLSPEFGIGAITETGRAVWGGSLDAASGHWREERAAGLQRYARQLREQHLGTRAPLPLQGRTAIIVDDGIATGLTMLAAIQALRERGAGHIVAAAPVSSHQASDRLLGEVDEVVVLCEPIRGFGAVGEYYDEFAQVGDEELGRILSEFRDHPDRTELIDLPGLESVLTRVTRYPASSAAIARKARALRAPASVVGFFESIPGGTVFEDREDVLQRTRQVELIMEEEQSEPADHTYPGD